MEMRAKIDENDRANLSEGQAAVGGNRFDRRADVSRQGRGALGAGEPRRLLRGVRGDAAVRRDVPVRDARSRHEGRRVGARHGRGQGDAGRADRAAAGGVPEERQDARVRQGRRAGSSSARSRSCSAPRAGRPLEGIDEGERGRAGRSHARPPERAGRHLAACRRREARVDHPARTRRRGCQRRRHASRPHVAHDRRLPAGAAPRPRQPPRPQAALAADDAGHDLRRGRRGRDAVDRRGRAAGGHGLHRAARREQPDRRSARSVRLPDAAESQEDVQRA